VDWWSQSLQRSAQCFVQFWVLRCEHCEYCGDEGEHSLFWSSVAEKRAYERSDEPFHVLSFVQMPVSL